MITTKKLKIWTIITHGLIIVGAGHGFACLFVIEIVSFPYLAAESFSFAFRGVDNHFALVGLLSLSGQISLLISILARQQYQKKLFHILGAIFFWLSIIYFTYDTTKDSYIHIALFSVTPFVICIIFSFFGQPLKKLYDWTLDN